MKYVFVFCCVFSFVFSKEITLEEFYTKFNMRTIFSSHGQMLKYYCQTYPFEYFHIEKQTKNILVLRNGDNYWNIQFESNNTINLTEQVVGYTYLTNQTYHLTYDSKNDEWKSNQTYLAKDKECEDFIKVNKGK